ncbi:transcriptional adapter 2-alpha [Cladophialophora psammophila CBS 110553]|uniref:Transcriptional adapter 2-alpha n=1 Tax=Cladophialophora psammophila CBS 110553 TaxID=1182543 RepID=W9XB20_9EURO|nr:transcriptional adapter 2-alpha [Cladophialophora psammophila CBS 110553]EXJ67634.1 transcriptional adapter 2-alpha [Cladophialophora psammophila CBS 110553]
MAPIHSPPPTQFAKLSFPAPGVVVVTLSRPEKLNCMSAADVVELTKVFRWLDDEPSLLVAVLTGAGEKAFSTGADLKEWQEKASARGANPGAGPGDVPGAVPLSNRVGKKPVIAAVNGMALGGGCEMVVNCDLVIAANTATFGLVEVKRGVAPYAGVLPRLIRTLGLQRASEMALTGNYLTAQKAMEWGLVNKVVPQQDVVKEAVKYAKVIAENSPDSVICTRAGLRQGWETASVVEATAITRGKEWAELQKGDNILEGLRAFKEKRPPVWSPSKL